MDLSKFDSKKAAEQGAVLQLRNPATDAPLTQDDGSPITITLAGTDSDRFNRAARDKANRRLAQSQRKKPTVEDMESDLIELLVTATLDWSGILVNGETLKCTPDNARKLYTDFPWIREQANAFAGDRANFLPA